jgi:hypothetical protein
MTETIDIVVAETGADEAATSITRIGDAADTAAAKVDSLGAAAPTISSVGDAADAAATQMASFGQSTDTSFHLIGSAADAAAQQMVSFASSTESSMSGIDAAVPGATTGISGLGHAAVAAGTDISHMAGEAATDLASVGAAADDAAGSLHQLSSAGNEGMGGLGIAANDAGEKLSEFGAKGAESAKQVAAGTHEAAAQMDVLGLATGKLTSLLSILGIAFGAKYVLDTTQAYLGMENSIRQVTKSEEEMLAVQQKIIELSTITFTSQERNADSYKRLSESLHNSTATGNEVISMLKSIDSFMSAAGKGADEAAAMVNTLSFGFTKNMMAGRPMMMMLRESVPMYQALAASLNLTVPAMEALAKAGGLTTEVMVKAMTSAKFVQAAHEALARAHLTLANATQVLKDKFMDYIGSLDQSNGLTAALARGILAAADNIKLIVTALEMAVAAWVTYKTVALASLIAVEFETFTATVAAKGLMTAMTGGLSLVIPLIAAVVVAIMEYGDQVKLTEDGSITLKGVMVGTWDWLGKAISATAQLFVDFAIKTRDVGVALGEWAAHNTIIQGIGEALKTAYGWLEKLWDGFKTLMSYIPGVSAVTAELGKQLSGLYTDANLAKVINEAGSLTKAMQDASKAVSPLKTELGSLDKAVGDGAKAASALGKATGQTSGSFLQASNAVTAHTQALVANAKTMAESNKATADGKIEQDKLNAAYVNSGQAARDVMGTFTKIISVNDGLGVATVKASSSLEGMAKIIKVADDDATRLGAVIPGVVTNINGMATSATKLGDAAGQVGPGIQKITSSVNMSNQAYTESWKLLDDGTVAFISTKKGADQLNTVIGQTGTTINSMNQPLDTAGKSLETAATAFKAINVPLDTTQKGMESLNIALAAVALSSDQSIVSLTALGKELDAISTSFGTVGKSATQMQTDVNTAMVGFATSMDAGTTAVNSFTTTAISDFAKVAAAAQAMAASVRAAMASTNSGGGGGGSSYSGSSDSAPQTSSTYDYSGGQFGMATGGTFDVGGQGGTDTQLVQFMATPGERVNVTTPGQRKAQTEAGAGTTVVVQMTVNAKDADSFNLSQKTMAMKLQSELSRALRSIG